MTTYRAWNLKPLDRSALKELTAAIAQQSTEELESRAMETMDGEPWSEEKYQMTLAAQQKEAGLLAGILAARGITDPAEALTLLSGEEELTDPMLLTDMDKACARILDAIDREETIVVFGDYDVDGVTATALLYQHLKGMGANVKCMLPSREGDGYGLSKNAIQSIHDKGCQLIVTVDNGISALEEAEFAASLGVDLIVTDHHLPHDTLPKAVAVVDPRRWNAICPSISTASPWNLSGGWTSWLPTVPRTPPRCSCWKRPWWRESTLSRRGGTAACACGRAMPASMRSGSGCTRSSCPMPPAMWWTRP